MDSIAAITEKEIKLISALVSFLDQEQDALKNADTAALPGIAAEKLKLIEQLNIHESYRGKLLGCSGIEGIRSAMEHWLDSHPGDKPTKANWEKLLDLARKAKQAHELNSRLIGMHLQQNTELLSALTRQSPGNLLYGNTGQTALTTGSRIVDSA